MGGDWCVKIYFQKIAGNLTNILWKNNGNLDESKQDSCYSLWLDYNILLSSKSPGNHFFSFSDHIMWFSLPKFRYELLSFKVEW